MKILAVLIFIVLSLAVGAMCRYWGTLQTVPEILPRFGLMFQTVIFFAVVFVVYVALIAAGWLITHALLK